MIKTRESRSDYMVLIYPIEGRNSWGVLLELTRYIQLNPLRAGLVKNINELDRFGYAGHCAILDRCENDWQETDFILRRFGRRRADAKRHYRDFVYKGVEQGRRPELIFNGSQPIGCKGRKDCLWE